MHTPKTLLQMAGADPRPATFSEAVLIVVDAQNEYLDGALALPELEPALNEVAALLGRARTAGTPIIHVQHAGRPGGLFDIRGHSGAFLAAARPQDNELIVQKSLPNSFAGTDLMDQLQRTGRTKVLLAGFMTHMCISATARSALDHGLAATVVASACATRDLPDPTTGDVIPASQIHRVALAELADRFAIVARSVADLLA